MINYLRRHIGKDEIYAMLGSFFGTGLLTFALTYPMPAYLAFILAAIGGVGFGMSLPLKWFVK